MVKSEKPVPVLLSLDNDGKFPASAIPWPDPKPQPYRFEGQMEIDGEIKVVALTGTLTPVNTHPAE